MPSRLSKLFSSEKQTTLEADSQQSRSPPPEYSLDQESFDPEHNLNPPDLTAGFSNLKITSDKSLSLPRSIECIAHLKLLYCFYRLRQTIGSTDGLFGIHDSVVHSQQPRNDETASLLAKLAEKRWAVYVARAVDRFDVWSQARFPSTGRPTIKDIAELGSTDQLTKTTCISSRPLLSKPCSKLTANDLPPVDVLLVWHSFMLNPRAYFEDCLHKGMMHLWHQSMPWEEIASSIDSKTFAYTPDDSAVASFLTLTDRAWDNLEDKTGKKIICTKCERVNYTEWTDVPEIKTTTDTETLSSRIDKLLSSGLGFCDQEFSVTCQGCGCMLSHDYLCAGKFCRDMDLLLQKNVPLPGTFFSVKGVPGRIENVPDIDALGILVNTNGFFTSGLGYDFKGQVSTMEDVRDIIEQKRKDKMYVYLSRERKKLHNVRSERIAIRRMMSRYWSNSSNFPLDLVGAVVRQGSFIEKMYNIDWLHSPALYSTMDRLVVKYSRFLDIMRDSKQMAVPTLDVDLAWHTHQLRPHNYMIYTVKTTAQFIDHDDKVAEVKLNDAFAWTSKQYQRRYGEPYSECTCWYCEAVRESHTSGASRLFKTNNAKASDKLHPAEQDPLKSVHISAHNVVRPVDEDYERVAESRALDLNRAYEAACSRAKSKGRPVPRRDDYYYSQAYGYPVYIPAYAPFMAPLPYTPCVYPYSPGCMAVTSGAAGNCCSGTCGSSVAAGGCASSFGGSCAGGAAACSGGAAGGCGGGSGGGGGGCGGGGGGGGGGCGGGGGGGC